MLTHAIVKSCGICGGDIAVKEPRNVTAKDGSLKHAFCNARQEAPKTPVVEIDTTATNPTQSQYNCGHYAYGSVDKIPESCPECGDLVV